MSTITIINGSDQISSSDEVINANFANLDNDKVETSMISTDNTLGGASPSDLKLPTEKAVSEFVTAAASPVGKSWNEYAESATGTDSYSVSIPGVSAYVVGQTYKVKADVANTGACTLNVNGLGAKGLKKNVNESLQDNEIGAGQLFIATYDGTNMQITSPLSPAGSNQVTVRVYTSSGTWTKPTGLKFLKVQLVGGGGASSRSLSGSNQPAGGAAYCEKMYNASSLDASEPYVVGVGGRYSFDTISASATSSTFKSMSAGYGGSYAYTGTPQSMAGGVASGGDLNINGESGVSATKGGSSHTGFGGWGTVAGVGYGAGAGYGTVGTGLDGNDGIAILTEYY